MSGYQHLQNYKGSLYGNLNYSGIEYDFEVPDNVVIASPGGVSGIHHHYTKGMYSDASSNKDIYAGEGVSYPYGEYGNLYQSGQSATRYMGDYHMHPSMEWEGPYPTGPGNVGGGRGTIPSGAPPGGDPMKKKDNYPSTIDNYTPMELISPPDTDATTPVDISSLQARKKKMKVTNIFGVVVVLIVGYTAMNFWVKGGEDYISKRFFGDQPLGWKQFLIIATTLTLITVVMMYLFGEPLVTLEKM
jgi:hypothetical protein